ncbi:multidrug effflux MFS transporter [Dermacoccaceae bacterium W4C1]
MPASSPGATRAPVLLVIIWALLAMIGPFTIDTIFPGFAAMEDELGVSAEALQQVLSVYLLTLAVMSLLHGPLSDALGRRPVIIVACIGYALASIGCALAPNFTLLLVMRALQGLFAGAGTIVGRAMIRDLLDASAAQRTLSQVTMVFGAAPAIAPIVGGLLIGHGWRSIFWFLVALGGGLAIAATFLLPESLPAERRTPLRPLTVCASAWERFCDLPTAALALAAAANFSAMFLYIASAPAFVEDHLHLGARDYGYLFVPLISGMIVGSFVSGRLSGHWSPTRSAGVGLAISTIAGLGNVAYTFSPADFALPWAVLGPSLGAFGIALGFPVMILAIMDRAPHARGAAASVQTFTQMIIQAAVSSFAAPWLSGDPRWLALGALSATAMAALLWVGYLSSSTPERSDLRVGQR